MAASVCAAHGGWPAEYRFTRCPICSERTAYSEDAKPQENWEGILLQQLEHVAPTPHEAIEIPQLEGVKVRLIDKRLWIHVWDVYAAGLRYPLHEGELIQIGAQVFEILRFDQEDRLYLVRTFSTTLSDEDLAKLAGP